MTGQTPRRSGGGARPAATTHARVARTRAATDANRKRAAARAAYELARRLEHLDDERVATLAGVLVAEALARGLAVPDLR